jgi:hypothetical protein
VENHWEQKIAVFQEWNYWFVKHKWKPEKKALNWNRWAIRENKEVERKLNRDLALSRRL